jgi:NADP-dependent 3-hydroxy acid dehydrogenase YdfG
MNMTGKVVVVTGGGSGVGKSVAKAMAQAGAHVAISGRDRDKLDAVVDELQMPNVTPFVCDVTQADQCAGLIADVEKSLGAVDQLINNAGMNVRKRAIRELSLEDWNALIRTNLDGAFYCLRAVLPGMLARRNGVIVNIVSVAGKRANPLGGAGYVAAKFGMGGLGMCLSNEERESGIRVSNIYPGEIDTPILANRPKPVSDEQRKLILKPDDVAAAVMFVATLPVHVSVPELIIKPTAHAYW